MNPFYDDLREIEFNYQGKRYFMAYYNEKKCFRKIINEYWFIDEKNELYKFATLEELMEVEVDGEKLKNILDKIEITYP